MPGEVERTLLIVKPDGVQRGLVGVITSRWETRGYKLVGMKMIIPTKEQASVHYDEHKSRPFFPDLVSFLSSGPVVLMVFEGKGVISASRIMIGATNPLTSAPGTIRGDYAVEIDKNIIHGSDSPQSAQREISIWFSTPELLTWSRHSDGDVYASS